MTILCRGYGWLFSIISKDIIVGGFMIGRATKSASAINPPRADCAVQNSPEHFLVGSVSTQCTARYSAIYQCTLYLKQRNQEERIEKTFSLARSSH